MAVPVAIYKLPFMEELENSNQEYAIDYGGSLIKIIYRAKEQDPKDKSTLSCAVFSHGDLEGLAEFINKNVILKDYKNASKIHTTGVGIKKDGPKLEGMLCRKFKHYNEMDCFGKAVKVIFPCLSKEELFYPLHKEGFETAMNIVKEFMKMGLAIQEKNIMDTEFMAPDKEKMNAMLSTDIDTLYKNYDMEHLSPGVIIMSSSGFAACKYDENLTVNTCGYSSRGGRTLMGLGSLLTKAKDYEELMELAAKGDNSKVDILIKSLKGGDKDDFYGLFPDDGLCFNFGHAYGKTIDDFAREDLAAAVVCLSCDDLANFALNIANANQCQSVTICGTMVNHEIARKFITMSFVSNGIDTPSKNPVILRMCKLGPYLGVIGSWKYGIEEETSGNNENH